MNVGQRGVVWCGGCASLRTPLGQGLWGGLGVEGVGRTGGQSAGRSARRSVGRSVGQSVGRPSVGRSVAHVMPPMNMEVSRRIGG